MAFPTVGVLGGGQLGRMMVQAAQNLAIPIRVLDAQDCPAGQILPAGAHVVGDFNDDAAVAAFARGVDLLTVEVEHIATAGMRAAQTQHGVPAYPSPETLEVIKDKYAQKAFLQPAVAPMPIFAALDGADRAEQVRLFAREHGYPVMLKSRTMAYDGRGNAMVRDASEIDAAITLLAGPDAACPRPLYMEAFVPFVQEIAVLVVRSRSGATVTYDVLETVQQNSICHVVKCPAQVPQKAQSAARQMALAVVEKLQGVGLFAVEMFVTRDHVLFNEVAPRPHNSGHLTIEACATSQFENHLRAILDLPLRGTALRVPAALMLNLLGPADGADGMRALDAQLRRALEIDGAALHPYGKAVCRRGRKMAHITFTGTSMAQLEANAARSLLAAGDASALAHLTQSYNGDAPLVGIIMGSISDMPKMAAACHVLERSGVPFEVSVVSAHRTPDRMVTYAKQAEARGLQVLICGAGGAAHLPGMTAAMTPLPVIGVPVALSQLDGQDSLYSIVQMPRGTPVATVGINNSTNAAYLALRILGVALPRARHFVAAAHEASTDAAMQTAEDLDRHGWRKYEA
ncbi:hypothetical protein CXG81DRAFT_12891 [Caulochytrium protostelioides]|uniref:Phosphoribosylaminoimidazole carboxylase n=1 Tax=Caulochytrium protostelioides TaxID=1555241 RepID=A0A4P9X6U5_9FUNG|nr:Phosphoribosylaminoimidazole carboxylase [Caulochytrium protostelioides]RKP00750.1 hypothetical protein CXG81DRAFT_12891 [Caulochytrium protostelioides]|eukprot:RKP00750.1 hypothetical protein CXG81DRAFT_12891 [Caulochytrium protostelioides]